MGAFLYVLLSLLFEIEMLRTASSDKSPTVALIVIDMSEEQWRRGPEEAPIISNWTGISNILSLAKALPKERVIDSRIWLSAEDNSTIRKVFPGGIAETKKAELCPELRELSEISTFVKKIQYSAFFGSELHALLQAQGVDTLMLTGINTDYCVLATALDAFYLGYKVWLIEDACTTFNGEEGHQLGIQEFKRFLFQEGKVMNTSQALDNL